MTARLKKVIEEMAELSPSEMAELVERFRELRAVNDEGSRVCRNIDLLRFKIATRQIPNSQTTSRPACANAAPGQTTEPLLGIADRF